MRAAAFALSLALLAGCTAKKTESEPEPKREKGTTAPKLTGTWLSVKEDGAAMTFAEPHERDPEHRKRWVAYDGVNEVGGYYDEPTPGNLIVTVPPGPRFPDGGTLKITYRFEGDLLVLGLEGGKQEKFRRKK